MMQMPLLVAGLVAAPAATEADVMAISACLDKQDVGCAEDLVERSGLATDADPNARAFAASVAFNAGDYPRAYDLMSGAVADGADDPFERLALYERTMYATAGWVEAPAGRFRIRFREGTDAILVDGAVDALQRTDRYVTPLIGDVPPGNTIVELFPDGRSFIAASSLTKDDVYATGVIALSKWTRLLVTSPRAKGGGYDWQATLSHEYIHLVVAAASHDEAPVWLQEGIAKYLDSRWQTGRDIWKLSPMDRSNLARALSEDDLVPFSEMHPSLAKIKVFGPDGSIDQQASAQRSQTAYAQLSSLVAFCFEKAGDEVIKQTLVSVRDGEDPRTALASAAGFSGFDDMLSQWEAWVRGLDLIERKLAETPTVLDGGDESDADPLLSQRKDLARFVRLGDLLYERERYRAASIEYDKAIPEDDEANSPLLSARRARAAVALGQLDDARKLLSVSLDDYPDHAESWRVLGRLEAEAGRISAATAAWKRAVDLDPFRLPAQQTLLDLYKETGDAGAVDQERRVDILRRGGERDARTYLHTRFGEYELPRSKEVVDAEQARKNGLEGSRAPDFEVDTLEGETIRLSDLEGQVVMLDFWATWCGPCRAVMPALSDMHEDYNEQGLHVVSISNEATNTVKRYIASEKSRGREYAQHFGMEAGEVRRAYGIRSLPTLAVVDRTGTVRLVHVGAGDMTEVRALVETLLAESAQQDLEIEEDE
jgi:thiol-disulfide isomerase/thioredoxin